MKLRCFSQAQTIRSWQPRSECRIESKGRTDRPVPVTWEKRIGRLPENLLRMFKMDAADFWQQARAPFGLQTTLHQYNSPPNQQQAAHHTLHHSMPQEHELLADVHPGGPVPGSGPVNSSNPLAPLSNKVESSHILQQHSEQQSYGDSFRGTQSPQLSSHHLLFNAAAAAAAAAHLKSTAMQNNLSPMGDQAQGALRTYGHSSLNALCGIKPKQEMDAKPLDDGRQPLAQAQAQPQPSYAGDFYDVGEAPATEAAEAEGRVLAMGSADESLSTPQAQQQAMGGRGLQTPQGKPMSPRIGGSSSSGTGTGTGTGAGPRPGPTMSNKTLSLGQQSPQHSSTPSGGSTTPDIKFNNDKMASEIQLQLSRSSSAAAISERTLEECWSTLQRLFMHKSAMQQIQQQIPRVGLGTHGVAGSAALGGSITPGSDTKPHQCQQCMKSFSSNHQLVQHIRVHTGEKPYKCSYCDRRFKQLSHVQQHTRLHTGERPYKCHLPDCGRAFIQLSNLQQHLRNHDAQVERAKNRPFHCNICGKGFATESSLRTHTSKHAALIGGPNATSCPVCHKLFLGTEALVDHMKHVHKEKSPTPSGPASSQFSELNQGATGSGNGNGTGIGNEQISTQCTSESNCAQSSHQATTGGSNLIDSYLGKRRTANHPCPVCGKHYVNEGSLRKHLQCHAETSQLTNSLRMWPCSVCQAVFTHENGLLTHMESMRMDPKHQFAAQYVLSRAAAEQRERESLLAVTLAANSGTGGRIGIPDAGIVLPLGTHNSEGSNSKCPSPSANSECSSNGRLTSSTTSDQDQDIDHGLSENENSNQHNTSSSTNNNNNCTNNNNSNKMSELRLPSSGQYTMDTDMHVANRMSLMAAAAAAVAASRPQDGVDNSAVPSAAVQAAVVNLAAAMRMNNPSNGPTAYQQHHGDHTQSHHSHPHLNPHHHQQQQAPQHQQQQLSHLLVHTHHSNSNSRSQRSPNLNVPSLQNESSAAASIAMNMNVHMMRGSLEPDPCVGGMRPIEVLHQQQQQHHHHQSSNYSQHAVAPTTQQAHPHPHALHTSHHHPDPETALRMHQAEAILRSHTEAAFRLATGTIPGSGVKSEADQQQLSSHDNGSGTASSNDQQHRFHSHQQEHQLPSSS
ncbi:uncharacterized protein LOC108040160 isoform X2 [Drosophila rhopaloa]|uniref:Uncharacterized protein LOC108040160 isoform X2 n=1 Tax=Drosophila rhopaloa TaxID=1041015 RepID=A0A6P4E4J1_DRORH|nr:uncharacterized protein LOC108040160 isoform X2 [Drosophila rhopaloa]